MTRLLADPQKLTDRLTELDYTQARLARRVRRGRQFISKLVLGEKATCSDALAAAIERELELPAGALFLPVASTDEGHSVPDQAITA